MLKLKILCIALAAPFLVIATVPAHAAAIDSTLYTRYSFNFNGTVEWVVCGSLPGSSGCYGSGPIGPFGKVGALLEGSPNINVAKNQVTKAVYVLDVASGAGANEVALYVYKETELISMGTMSMALSKVVTLPLNGSSNAKAAMAANAKFIYIGTDENPMAVRVQKSNLAVTQVPGFSSPSFVSAITADKYGHVTVIWGSFSGNGPMGFYSFDATGAGIEDGGGEALLLNTTQAVLPSALP
jgi:hypothetical protein